MAFDADALNYPYIRIRDVNWLKRTLLVFPHVARISPYIGAPTDSPEVEAFRHLEGRRGPLLQNVDLDQADVWDEQAKLIGRIEAALAADTKAVVRRFGEDATLKSSSLARESASLWGDRLAGRRFQLHEQKVLVELVDLLFRKKLAWFPTDSHGLGYIEMHPRLGEAVLATLAFACARRYGLRLVTEFPHIYGRTIHQTSAEIIDTFLDNPPVDVRANTSTAPSKFAEFVVYHRCDVTQLTPEALLELNKEWEPIGAFREALEDLASNIPPEIDDPEALRQRLSQKADQMFARWNQDNKNWTGRLRDLFSGEGEDFGKVFEKVAEKFVAEGGVQIAMTGTAAGGVLGKGLIGMGAGLGVGLLVHTTKNALAIKKKRAQDPLRYLTMMEKAGVSYLVSA